MKYGAVKVLAVTLSILGIFGSQIRAQTTLVAAGSVWKYLDTGSNEGAAWRSLSFNDSGWSNGLAQLGFSSNPAENDEATFLSRTNTARLTNIQHYIRHNLE